jgi:cytochrome b subunit of formate dehydrogenase
MNADATRPTSPSPRTVACALAALLAIAAAPVRAQPTLTPEDRRCMECHGQAHITELSPAERLAMVGTWLDPDHAAEAPPTAPEALTGDEPATRPGLLVTGEHLAAGPHAELRCVECHQDAAQLPHRAKLNLSTCATECHSAAWDGYALSTHNEAFAGADERAPTCASCHGGHDILRVDDRHAPQHRLNSLFLCGDCHADHGSSEEGIASAERVSSYLDSTHARAITEAGLRWAATCSDCHDAHAALKADNPDSWVHRENIPSTCGKCHEGISEVYEHSIHGVLLADGDDRGPVCTDCHTAHSITNASSPGFMRDIINECGQCHDEPDPESGRKVGLYETYSRSYHGQVSRLGSTRAARCSDCHGVHDILPGDDPASMVNPQNLVATCSQAGCHPGANANFVQFDPHADYRDGENYPILYGVWWYFIIMMSSVFTFFGLHTLLWFFRSVVQRIREGAPPKHKHEHTAIRRFTLLNRVNHALVAITFFGLTATGIPLVFSHEAWAGVLAGFWGGVEAAGIWHRVFAFMLIVNFVLHFIGLGRAFVHRKCSWFQWVFGPNSLVPRWKDVTDCVGMFRWFAGRGKIPRFDRWAYWEKFDYWAEVGGSMIIGGTGLLLWFPELASTVLPGWVFNVAMIIHGYEALLAIGFIFTIHFFNAHVRPGTFPVDEVIFTGSLPEHELKETRPEEYDRLVRTGALDSLRVPAPKRHKAPLNVLIAVVSVGIGLGLLVLIIVGGLSML